MEIGGNMEKNMTGQAEPQQIDAWKKQYGEVYCVEVDGSVCYLHKPDRATLKAVASVGMNDPIRSNEVLLENCWIAGDESIKTDDAKFMGVSPVLAELVQIKEAVLKKL